MPQFTVFYRKLLRIQNRKEPQLSSNAEIRNYHVEALIQEGILAYLVKNKVCVIQTSTDCCLLLIKLIKTNRLQMHDVAYVKCLDPVILCVGFETESRATINLEFFFILKSR